MKVLFMFPIGDTSGGACAVWLNLIDGLMARGVEPFVIIPWDRDGSLSAELDSRGVKFRILFYSWWVTDDPNPHSARQKLRRLAQRGMNTRSEHVIEKIIRENDIELVYICDGTIAEGMRAGHDCRLPVVWHFHEFIRGARGGFSFIDSDAMVDRVLGEADCILTVTDSLRNHLVRNHKKLRRVVAVHNAVSADRVAADKGPILQQDGRVVFTLAGRVDLNKGQLDAINAFARIAADFPQAHLRLVGAGDPEVINECQALISALRLNGQVFLDGFHDDMPPVWKITDVALNCSFTEGCSSVIAEAACSGCLVLASDAEGNKELVDGFGGLSYERGDIDELAEQMRWILEHRDEARDKALASKSAATEMFSLDRQSDEVYSLFQQAIDIRKGRL